MLNYTYDDVGNITSEIRNGYTTSYAYDNLGQLTRVNDECITTMRFTLNTFAAMIWCLW